jgi:lysophospholipase L1-like esterase
MRRDSLTVRLGTVVLGIVAALVLAEGILQIGALVVRSRAREDRGSASSGAPGRVVLCVGDSFTYGSGSSSAATSYPGHLESWLNETEAEGGPRWTVRNAGWPGRNSTELVRRLPRFLDEVRPDYVCVLVGANNRWNVRESNSDLPEAADVEARIAEEPAARDDTDGGFRWRLPRLMAIVAAAVRERFGGERVRTDAAAGAAPTDAVPFTAIDTRDPAAALARIRASQREASSVGPLLDTLQALRPRIRAAHDAALSTALVLTLADMNLSRSTGRARTWRTRSCVRWPAWVARTRRSSWGVTRWRTPRATPTGSAGWGSRCASPGSRRRRCACSRACSP